VVDATFSHDGESMIVVGCPDHALPHAEAQRTSPTTKVWRWDLQRDEVPNSPNVAFDAQRNLSVAVPSIQDVETVAGTLYAQAAEGRLTPVTHEIPYGTVDLMLVDSAGKTTKLARPGTMGEQTAFGSGCEASPDRTRVLCWRHVSTFENESWIWDQRGKLLGSIRARTVTFSRDGSRLLTIDKDRTRLLEASSLRELRSERQDGFDTVSFNRDGSLVAWSTVGVVDAATGATLWGDARTYFNGFLPGEPLRVVTNEGDFHGPLAIRDGRTGSLLHAFVGETRVVDVSDDGTRLVTRAPDKNHHVFDSARAAEVAVLGRAENAEVSADGQFSVLDAGHGKLLDVGTDTPGHRPGLTQDFWAGKSVTR
jgi:hypothetical protein